MGAVHQLLVVHICLRAIFKKESFRLHSRQSSLDIHLISSYDASIK